MDALEQLDALFKGSFPPPKKKSKPAQDDDDQADDQGQDNAQPLDDQDDGAADDSDPSMESDDDSADGDDDSAPEDHAEPDGDEGMGGPGDGDGDETPPGDEGDPDDPGSFAEMDADNDGDIDADDAALSGGGAGGDVNALAEQLIEAERNYYAAVGHKGHANHNTVRLLEDFHKILRKFVRAATANQVSDDNQVEDAPDDEAEIAEGGDPAGDGFPDEEEQGRVTKSQRAMEHGYRAFGRQHGLAVLVGVEPLSQELRKGTWDFRDTMNMAQIPDQYLMPYLVAFIEAAYSEYCCAAEVKDNPEKSAAKIMMCLVTLLPQASNLLRAVEKIQVTEAKIARILKDRGIISIAQAAMDQYLRGTPTDADSLRASGAENLNRSSGPDWMQPQVDLRACGSVLALADRARPVQLEDDRRAPMVVQRVNARFAGQGELMKATVHSLCRIHSNVDLRKTDMLTHAFAQCTCPR